MHSPYSNASTPPRRTTASTTPGSRVDAFFDRPQRVSFLDSAVSEDDDYTPHYGGSPGVRRDDASTTATSGQCWSCRQTQRLRTALKRVELDYVAQIEALQAQLKHATTQRALALQERDALLTSADAATTQQSMVEQEAQSLRVEVMQAMQERHDLRRRVQELEKTCRSTALRELQWGVKCLFESEAMARAACVAAEAADRGWVAQLQRVEHQAGEEVRRAAVATPRRCNAASGTPANGSTILSSTFSPNTTSSPGPSDGGRERRTVSPRPSQRRDLSSSSTQQHPHHTQRPTLAGDSARSGSEGGSTTFVVARSLQLTQSIEDAEERVRKVEWKMEQQRSAFEMQLADERALTADMQAEVDDLIGNELVLLESESRLRLERDSADALATLSALHVRRLTAQLCQRTSTNAAAASSKTPARADVLNLVDEGENAAWRTETSEAMFTIQQQLYQLVSAAKPAHDRSDDSSDANAAAWEDVRDCVTAEAAEVKEHLAVLLDASAQARVDGDALREEMQQHFSEVEERQCRQEAFMVAMSTRPAKQEAAPCVPLPLLQSIQQQLEQQRQLSERLCEMLQRTLAKTVETMVFDGEDCQTTLSAVWPSSNTSTAAAAAASASRAGASPPQQRPKTRHRDPSADLSTLTNVVPVRLGSSGGGAREAVTSSSRRPSLSAPSPSCEEQLSTLTTVSVSTTDNACTPLQERRASVQHRWKATTAEEALFEPQRVRVDVHAAAEQISALLSDGSSHYSDSDCPSPYEEY